jgi:hypothetical protein
MTKLAYLCSDAAPAVWFLTDPSRRILRISFWAASSRNGAIHSTLRRYAFPGCTGWPVSAHLYPQYVAEGLTTLSSKYNTGRRGRSILGMIIGWSSFSLDRKTHF